MRTLIIIACLALCSPAQAQTYQYVPSPGGGGIAVPVPFDPYGMNSRYNGYSMPPVDYAPAFKAAAKGTVAVSKGVVKIGKKIWGWVK